MLLFAGVMFQNPRKKRKFANSLSPSQIQCFIVILVFLLSLQKHYDGSCIYCSLQVPEHNVEWLEDLPELPSNFDAPLHWRVRYYQLYFFTPSKTLEFRIYSNCCPDQRDFKFLIRWNAFTAVQYTEAGSERLIKFVQWINTMKLRGFDLRWLVLL